MRFLLIDTSTERGLVAISSDEKIVYQTQLPFGLSNSKHLLPAIKKGLSDTGIRISQLDAIVAGVGPGSYTGIRVAVTVAKTIAFAANKPLIGICTLEAFVPEQDGPFAVLVDAKISGAYLLLGEKRGSEVKFHTTPQVFSIDSLATVLKGTKQIVTPNAHRLQSLLHTSELSWQEKYPDPNQMMRIAERQKNSTNDKFEILYLRKAECEK